MLKDAEPRRHVYEGVDALKDRVTPARLKPGALSEFRMERWMCCENANNESSKPNQIAVGGRRQERLGNRLS